MLGLVSGAVLGMLYAPRTGKQLREHMKKDRKKGGSGIKPLTDDVKDFGKSLQSLASDMYSTIRQNEAVAHIVKEGQGYVQDLTGDFADDFHDFRKHTLDPVHEEIRRSLKKHAAHAKNLVQKMQQKPVKMAKKTVRRKKK